jgi:hypothetical protein
MPKNPGNLSSISLLFAQIQLRSFYAESKPLTDHFPTPEKSTCWRCFSAVGFSPLNLAFKTLRKNVQTRFKCGFVMATESEKEKEKSEKSEWRRREPSERSLSFSFF